MSLLLARRRTLLFPSEAAAASYADEVLADSPFAWWRMTETSGSTAADEVGTNDLTVYGANLNVSGPAGTGSAASFDGTDDYMQGSRLNLTTAFTFEAIVNIAGLSATGRVVGNFTTSHTGDDVHRGALLNIKDDEKLQVWVMPYNDAFSVNAASLAAIPLNEFVHVAATWGTTVNSGVPRLYVNGTETDYASTEAETSSLDGAGSFAYVGCSGKNVSEDGFDSEDQEAFLDGTVDEPAVYNAALSAARILAHAQAGGFA